MLLGANRFGGPATPALPRWGKQEAIHADGKSPSRICVHRDLGPIEMSGSTNVHRHEGERKRER